MKTIAEIRLENLLKLRAKYGTTMALAHELKKSEGQVGQWIRSVRAVGEKIAREVEMALSLPLGWLDHDHEEAAAPGRARARTRISPPHPRLPRPLPSRRGLCAQKRPPISGGPATAYACYVNYSSSLSRNSSLYSIISSYALASSVHVYSDSSHSQQHLRGERPPPLRGPPTGGVWQWLLLQLSAMLLITSQLISCSAQSQLLLRSAIALLTLE